VLDDAGVPRSAEDFFHPLVLGDLPDQGVFPSPASNDQNFHSLLQIFHRRGHRAHEEKNPIQKAKWKNISAPGMTENFISRLFLKLSIISFWFLKFPVRSGSSVVNIYFFAR
jgi:hypothetical protein